MRTPLTQEEATRRVASKHKDKIWIEPSSFVGSEYKCTAHCKACGHTWHPTYNNVVRGSKCRKCRDTRNGDRLRMPLDTALTLLYKWHGNTISISGFTAADGKCSATCLVCNNLWYPVFGSLKQGGCPACSYRRLSGNMTMSGETAVKNVFEWHGGDISIDPSSYKGSCSTLEARCNLCDNEWYPQYANLRNHGCPSCAQYGIDLSLPGVCYLMVFDNNQETFIKVGIANGSARLRYRDIHRGYTTSLLREIFFDKTRTAKTLESKLLYLQKVGFGFTPSIWFSGHTECLMLESKAVVQNNISNFLTDYIGVVK